MKFRRKIRPTVWQLLALGYLAVIVTGSVLLVLPIACKKGLSTSYLNAFFTAVSATCVTGLVPYDTATHWTLFGQFVILFMIQLGGLGFMSFVSIVFQMFGKGMDIYGRTALMQSSGSSKFKGVSRLVKRILIGSLLCELIGALLLSIRFIPVFGWGNGIYFSVWHSVSAFCNAGFDLMGTADSQFVSLSAFATDPLVSLTICTLIILGGLGFCVWGDMLDCRFKYKKYQLNTKVVLIVNGILLVAGTALFLLFERNNALYAEYNFGERLLVSFFNATSPRTAGFATTDLSALSDSGYLLTVILMFIGGSSGSTAGGLKVGTFAVIMAGMSAVFRGNKDINIGRRRLEPSLLYQALAIFAAYLLFVLTSTIIICTIEEGNATFGQVLFECVSALGTVGLSLSLTPYLSAFSKIILIILMYTGRVGILTIALALAQKRTQTGIRKPVDKLLIG